MAKRPDPNRGSYAALLEKMLSQIPGAHRAEASFEEKRAILDYDPRSVDPSRFAKPVRKVGFKAAESATANN